MKTIKKELSILECNKFLNSDGSINGSVDITLYRDLKSLSEYDKHLLYNFFRVRNYPRKKKKFHKLFWRKYFVFPISFRKKIFSGDK